MEMASAALQNSGYCFDWPHAAEEYSILFNQLIQGLRSATK
jgi:hypothetical protein